MHILLAVDGSEGGHLAVDTLAHSTFAPGTRVTVLFVLTRYVPSDSPMPDAFLTALREDENARADQVVQEAAKALAPHEFDLDIRVEDGHPAAKIIEVAEAVGADMIMLGALGVTGWLRAVLGSTSLTVVRHAPCPVWVVKRPPKATRFDVLATSDGSANARHALDFLLDLPLREDTVLHLLHVVPALNQQLHLTGSEVDPPVLAPLYKVGEHFKSHGKQVLKADSERMHKRFSDVRAFTLEGDARHKIMDAAQEVEADLIVMGTKGLSGIKEFFLGSISHKVLKHAATSILVVPLPHE